MQVLSHYLLFSLGLADAETQTTEAERACLRSHVRGCRRVVEIGVWHAVTTAELLGEMPDDAVLYAVDPYPAGRLGISFQRRIARRQVSRVDRNRVRWLETTGVDAAETFAASGEPPVDFVFIDGDHSYRGLEGDWSGWSPLVREGGLIALHDSRSSPARNIESAGSAQFTKKVILADTEFELVDAVDTLTIVRRVSGIPSQKGDTARRSLVQSSTKGED